MSKERELLERAMSLIDYRYAPSEAVAVHREIQELLTQPEQDNIQYLLDQVARLTAENAMLKEKWLAQTEYKREPLSDEAICQILLKKEWKGFVDLVRIIEKEHGITGGGE